MVNLRREEPSTVCGRYVSVSTPERLAEHFAVDEVRTEALEPRYNVAPTLDVYAVIEREGTRRLGTLRWGLVPFWAKRLKGSPAPINARVESVHENSMFSRAFQRRRCLLPADGFYEWQVREDGARKQPYFIHDPDDAPLAFAGIWGAWRDPGGSEDAGALYSCAILTMPARGEMSDLHDRMPVVLPRQLWADWLTASPEEAPHLQEAVAALAPPPLAAYTITDRVNNVRNEGAALLEPGEVA